MLEKLLAISEPWLQYAIRLNLCGEKRESLESLQTDVLKDHRIQQYLADITAFHNRPLKNHNDPELPIHKLLFLLDIGLDSSTPEIASALDQIRQHQDRFGVYQSLANIPPHYGGRGEDVFGWCLCDAPLLLRALLQAGLDYRQHIQPGVKHLVSLGRAGGGFSCAVSAEHGKFRGPGRKDDCCPYATLIMVDLLAEIAEYKDSAVVRSGAEVLLSLWEHSRERHPYMFYTGTDFRKLKAPAIWYDLVSVSNCLSKLDGVKADPRFREMIGLIQAKQDADGLFTPESVYQKCQAWDFGQKKAVSPYLSYLCIRILQRAQC